MKENEFKDFLRMFDVDFLEILYINRFGSGVDLRAKVEFEPDVICDLTNPNKRSILK